MKAGHFPDKSSPCILTSLSPNSSAVERQREALISWQKAGFRPISLNFPEEKSAIEASFSPWVEVKGVSEACLGCRGRHLVAVSDLIEASFQMNRGHAALVLNADIILGSEAPAVLGLPREGVTMIPRWQIHRPGEVANMEMDPWGYDGVLLTPETRGAFQNRAFGLGLPWWDYWIPFRALHLGHEVRILNQPLAFHVRHKEQWDEKDRARLAGEVWREVGVPPWKRFWRKHLGPKGERKNYGYHNHLAEHIRETISRKHK